ncbi:Uncharacterised protein [Mycobacteroides abscessus subsp. abscessus]|nr:Uncharacterised protein [Mycobacteroides abscessus subsp. abscessus]
MAGDERRQGGLGLIPLLLRLMGVDRAGVEHLAGAVHDRDLDSGAEAGVKAQGGAGARGRGQ